jgi:hypothetical protein
MSGQSFVIVVETCAEISRGEVSFRELKRLTVSLSRPRDSRASRGRSANTSCVKWARCCRHGPRSSIRTAYSPTQVRLDNRSRTRSIRAASLMRMRVFERWVMLSPSRIILLVLVAGFVSGE